MAGQVMRKCSGRDSGEVPDVRADQWQSSPCEQRFCTKMLRKKNMAPGKTHVNSKVKNKFQAKKRNSSGIKKAKNSSLPKKKV